MNVISGTLKSLIVCFSIAAATSFALVRTDNSDTAQAAIMSYGKLPLSFEQNAGQTDGRVKFVSRGPGYSLFLTGKEAVLSLQEREREISIPRNAIARSDNDFPRVLRTDLRMSFAGGNPNPEVLGLEELPQRNNYLIGNERTNWRTNIATFARVKYRDMYPGVDVIYYGKEGRLEYDLVVAAGADPRPIRLSFAGVANLCVDEKTGDLIITAANGVEMRNVRPRIYQQLGSRQTEVAGAYRILDHSHVAITLANYDRRSALVIDPTLKFSTSLGGSSDDLAVGVAVDSSGNSYITGRTTSSDFPAAARPYKSDPVLPVAFIAKLSASGQILFSTFIGGNNLDDVRAIAVDSSGVYVTGATSSTNFATNSEFGFGAINAFIAKFSLDGQSKIYCVTIGGGTSSAGNDGIQAGNAIALDSSHAAYIAGKTYSPLFPTSEYINGLNGLQPMQSKFGGYRDAFVVKVDANGFLYSSFGGYSTYLGGSGYDEAKGIAVDSTGHAYVTGLTGSMDFPTAGAIGHGFPGGGSSTTAFVTKLTPDGSLATYSMYLGGSRDTNHPGPVDSGSAIAVDPSGNVYIAGTTCTTNFPTTPYAFQKAEPIGCALGSDGLVYGSFSSFASKISAAGALVYSTYLGANGDTVATSIKFDNSQDVYVAGQTSATNFPGTPALTSNPGAGFVTKLNPSMGAVKYSVIIGAAVNGMVVIQARSLVQVTYPKVYVTGSRFKPGTSDEDAFDALLDEAPVLLLAP